MSIKDSHSRKASFDTKEELGDMIDKLVVMIGKLVTRDSRSGRQFKPQMYQGKVLCPAVLYVCKSFRLSRGKVSHMYICVGTL